MRASPITAVHLLPLAALVAAAACTPASRAPMAGPAAATLPAHTAIADVRTELYALADDSMQGRFTGSPGMWRAARYLAGMFRTIGLEPAGDDGYLQRMPLAWETRDGQRIPRLLHEWSDTTSIRPADRGVGVNVVGIVRGTDPEMRDQVVLIDAHFDHLGSVHAGFGCQAVGADTLCNGADDDGSGDVAVLEIARELRRGPPPRRTVVFLLTTGEEVGLLGTRWYIAHPVLPLERMVANMEIEMIGRPDSLAGGSGRAWLTGYERSTMGDMLASAEIPIVPDPRPSEQFFERSDNIAFARRGIPAHTLSSFNLHGDYHTAADEPSRVDYGHMTLVVRAAAQAARLLADGPAPVWKPGGQPQGGR